MFPLGDRAIIGRAPGCDVWLDDDALVSRRHARLTVCALGLVLEDLASRNGTFVNGERVSPSRLLAGGESLRFGATELTLVALDPERQERRLRWDDETAGPRRYPSPTGISAVTQCADAFGVVMRLARTALEAGHPERAERIAAPQLNRLIADTRAGRVVDPANLSEAMLMALTLSEALASGEWIAFVLQLHAATGTVLSSELVDRLYDLVRHVDRMDVEALTRYIDVFAAHAARLGPSETFRLRRVQGLASLIRVG